jgi:GPN-loop GTPase
LAQTAGLYIALSEWSGLAHACCLFIRVRGRYLMQNMDWLEEELGGYEDDYLIFDCPGMLVRFVRPIHRLTPGRRTGQIELYTHHPFLRTLVRNLSQMGIRTSAVYLIDSQFMEDRYKFFR